MTRNKERGKKMKSNALKITLSTLLVLSIAALNVAAAFAQGDGRLYLNQVKSEGNELVIEVVAAEVSNIYGAQFTIKYDPSALSVKDMSDSQEGIQIEVGDFLDPAQGFTVVNEADPQAGTVTMAITLVNPAKPVSGGGVLGRVHFTANENRPSRLELEDVKLVNYDLQAVLPALTGLQVQPGAEAQPIVAEQPDGQPAPQAQAPVEQKSDGGFPFWLILVVVGVVITVGALGWLAMTVLGKSSSNSNGGGASSRRDEWQQSANWQKEAEADDLVQEGKAALQHGNAKVAYDLFSRATTADPNNTDAWLGKGLTARSTSEKRICFQRVLALNPTHSVAIRELERLNSLSTSTA